MEKQIIIPLEEYEEIKQIVKKQQEAIEKLKSSKEVVYISVKDSTYIQSFGVNIDIPYLYNDKNQVVEILKKDIDKLEKSQERILEELREIRRKSPPVKGTRWF